MRETVNKQSRPDLTFGLDRIHHLSRHETVPSQPSQRRYRRQGIGSDRPSGPSSERAAERGYETQKNRLCWTWSVVSFESLCSAEVPLREYSDEQTPQNSLAGVAIAEPGVSVCGYPISMMASQPTPPGFSGKHPNKTHLRSTDATPLSD